LLLLLPLLLLLLLLLLLYTLPCYCYCCCCCWQSQVLGKACQLSSAEALGMPLLSAQGQQPADNLSQLQYTPMSAASAGSAAATPADQPLQDLLAGRVRCVEFSGGNVYVNAPRGRGRVYLPGSFNPLHEGHKQMLAAAVQLAGPDAEGCFELTVRNADKVGSRD
jgi:hypothetical protein